MKKLLVLILLVGIAILMTLTRPDKKAHKEAMMKAVSEYVEEETAERGLDHNVFGNMGKGLIKTAVSAAIDMKLQLNDYVLFNTTHVHFKGEDKTLSVGLFGQVITFDKEMLRDALESGDDLDPDKLLKEEKDAYKEAQKAEKKAQKEAKKQAREAEKAAKKAEKEAKKAAKKAEKEAKKAAKKAEKEAERAAREAAN
ncbi:MAG: DUF4359 domain-containing protein [Prevotella sp.]|nr:DUF4359 domain-containing protein [Prevotella sp.]